jgi:GDP-D-mannose dehydratase
MAKRALITRVTGQDGSYRAEPLLGKGYEGTRPNETREPRHLYDDLHPRFCAMAITLVCGQPSRTLRPLLYSFYSAVRI